jgi:hypothetical protein
MRQRHLQIDALANIDRVIRATRAQCDGRQALDIYARTKTGRHSTPPLPGASEEIRRFPARIYSEQQTSVRFRDPHALPRQAQHGRHSATVQSKYLWNWRLADLNVWANAPAWDKPGMTSWRDREPAAIFFKTHVDPPGTGSSS